MEEFYNKLYTDCVDAVLEGIYQFFTSPEIINCFKTLIISKIETVMIAFIAFLLFLYVGFTEKKSKKLSNMFADLWSVLDVYKK